jgi:hypothetical protein
MISRHFFLLPFLSFVIGCFIVTSVFAAADPYKDFVSSCTQAFDRSSGNGGGGMGEKICACTAKESKKEHVSIDTLKQETARIQQDPKYRIQNPGLLHALQNCSIELLQD